MIQGLQRYTIDSAHTGVEFVARHLMIAKVRGRFSGVTGSVVVDEESLLPKTIDVSVRADSIDTREEQRDAHLRSADFFDVEHFPTMTYRGTSVTGTRDRFELAGELTLHGVTRPLTLSGTFEGRSRDLYGKERIGYEARGSLSRRDFGLTWNAVTETGGVVVGDEIQIEISVEVLASE